MGWKWELSVYDSDGDLVVPGGSYVVGMTWSKDEVDYTVNVSNIEDNGISGRYSRLGKIVGVSGFFPKAFITKIEKAPPGTA